MLGFLSDPDVRLTNVHLRVVLRERQMHSDNDFYAKDDPNIQLFVEL